MAVAAYLLGIAAFVFCVAVAEALGSQRFCSVLLSLPLRVVGRPDTICQTFWLSVGYYPLLLLPALCYGISGRTRWMALQTLCAACHVGCALTA